MGIDNITVICEDIIPNIPTRKTNQIYTKEEMRKILSIFDSMTSIYGELVDEYQKINDNSSLNSKNVSHQIMSLRIDGYERFKANIKILDNNNGFRLKQYYNLTNTYDLCLYPRFMGSVCDQIVSVEEIIALDIKVKKKHFEYLHEVNNDKRR